MDNEYLAGYSYDEWRKLKGILDDYENQQSTTNPLVS